MTAAGKDDLAERRIRDLIAGAFTLPALLVAHELRLFPLLAKTPCTVSGICDALHLKPRAAEALVAMCAAMGLVSKGPSGYGLAPSVAEALLPGSPTSFGPYLDMIIEDARLLGFESVREAILADAPPAGRKGASRTRSLTLAMESRGAAASLVWPDLVDLSRHRVLLDVGGGSGIHSVGAVRRWPHLQAIVFDVPEVCELASERIAKHGLAGRIRTSAGDFHDAAPFPAADVHLYSEVLHNRSPEECRTLLSQSFLSLPPNGLLLVHEMLFEEKLAGPPAVAAANLNMLLRTKGGRQYSRPEILALLAGIGFGDARIAPAAGYFSLVSARKPGGTER